MELRQLECFVAVAEVSSFTEAARRLHTVQSGVSASIKNLERDVGARLFERGAGGVRLSVAGDALLPAARATLAAARAAREAVDRVTTGVSGVVSLGTLPSLDVVDLPALLARLRTEHPGIRVRLKGSSSGSSGLAQELARGDLDAALIANDGAGIPGVRLTWLLTAPVVALLPEDHRLAGRAGVRLAELADEQFIDFPAGFGNRRIVDEAYARLGLERTVTVEVTTVPDAGAYVRLGLGVSLVPFISEPPAGLCAVPIHRPALPWVLSLGTPATGTLSAPAQALIDLVPAYRGDLPPLPVGAPDRQD
ncbi:LysR family transcriptional regulator [Nocardioides plantarum]|uniref:LysR family transcriptional regulator n=1 Tax=Nocardioides plantarum TaxID=29299 RepID=A0ABV5KE35_9ACTN|nr:LysR family transcriptional regulator [Nocardioides plantarum]